MTLADPAPHLLALHARLPLRRYLAEMWSRRDFAVALPMEEVRAAHRNTLLGNIWHLANPLLSAAVYYLIFVEILDLDRGVDNDILWLVIGVFTFRFTSSCVLGGATSISNNQGLMQAIRFPRALLPVSVIVSKLLTFGFELAVLVVIALATGEPVTWRWLLLPIVVLGHSLFNLGGAFITARLNDSFRDLQQIIPFVMRLLLYMSGVIFPITRFVSNEDHWFFATLIEYNPMIVMLNLYRWVLLEEEIAVTGAELARLGVLTAVLLVAGFSFFRSAESRYGRG